MESGFGEVFMTCAKIDYMLSYGEDTLKKEVRFPGLLMLHKYSTVEYCPYGVIGIKYKIIIIENDTRSDYSMEFSNS
jgi:hypothetical protein